MVWKALVRARVFAPLGIRGGFGPPRQPPAGAPAAPQAPYGPSIIKYLEGKGISWVVWCFDPEWGPTLIGNWEYTLTPSGEFAKQAMHGAVQ